MPRREQKRDAASQINKEKRKLAKLEDVVEEVDDIKEVMNQKLDRLKVTLNKFKNTIVAKRCNRAPRPYSLKVVKANTTYFESALKRARRFFIIKYYLILILGIKLPSFVAVVQPPSILKRHLKCLEIQQVQHVASQSLTMELELVCKLVSLKKLLC